MGRTVSELLDTLDAAELQDWMAFYPYDPWDIRPDFAAAQMCSTLARVHGADLGPDRFMPQYGPREEPKPATDEELKDQALIFAALMKGTINDGNEHRKTQRDAHGQHRAVPDSDADGLADRVEL